MILSTIGITKGKLRTIQFKHTFLSSEYRLILTDYINAIRYRWKYSTKSDRSDLKGEKKKKKTATISRDHNQHHFLISHSSFSPTLVYVLCLESDDRN